LKTGCRRSPTAAQRFRRCHRATRVLQSSHPPRRGRWEPHLRSERDRQRPSRLSHFRKHLALSSPWRHRGHLRLRRGRRAGRSDTTRLSPQRQRAALLSRPTHPCTYPILGRPKRLRARLAARRCKSLPPSRFKATWLMRRLCECTPTLPPQKGARAGKSRGSLPPPSQQQPQAVWHLRLLAGETPGWGIGPRRGRGSPRRGSRARGSLGRGSLGRGSRARGSLGRGSTREGSRGRGSTREGITREGSRERDHERGITREGSRGRGSPEASRPHSHRCRARVANPH
jgi:hypothetical protein